MAKTVKVKKRSPKLVTICEKTVKVPVTEYEALLASYNESTRLQDRSAQLIEQINSVNAGSELLREKYEVTNVELIRQNKQISGLQSTIVENQQRISLQFEALAILRQQKQTTFDNAFAENEKLRNANEYASKRLAAYEAQFGFLPDELEEVEPLAAVTGNWLDFPWVSPVYKGKRCPAKTFTQR